MEVSKALAALENGETWFGSANSNFRDGHYSVALYSLEMSAEIALKAVLLSVKVNAPKIHDVSVLAAKYADEDKRLAAIKDNEKFIRDTFRDLLMYRNSAGYMFEYRKSEDDFKDIVSDYMPKTRRLLDICREVIMASSKRHNRKLAH